MSWPGKPFSLINQSLHHAKQFLTSECYLLPILRTMAATNESSVSEVKGAVTEALERHQRMLQKQTSLTFEDSARMTRGMLDTTVRGETMKNTLKLTSKADRISSLLEFADIEMEEEVPPEVARARRELVVAADVAEAAERKVDHKKASDELTSTVPLKLLNAWKYRRSQRAQKEEEEPLRNKGTFSMDHISRIKGKFKEVWHSS